MTESLVKDMDGVERGPRLLTPAEARRVALAYAAREFGRLSPSARQNATDRAVHAVHTPTATNVEWLTRFRCLRELEIEGSTQPAGQPRLIMIGLLGDAESAQFENLADPSGGAAFEHVEVDMVLRRCFVAASELLAGRCAVRVGSSRAGSCSDFQRRRAEVGRRVAYWGCRSSLARAMWTDDPKALVFRAMQVAEPKRWARYPEGRLPSRPDTARCGAFPAADWAALQRRFLPVVLKDVRGALQDGYRQSHPAPRLTVTAAG